MTEKTIRVQDVTFLQHLAPFSDVNVIGQAKILKTITKGKIAYSHRKCSKMHRKDLNE